MDVTGDVDSQAAAIGEAWAREVVHGLQSDDRDAVGAWPGTMREARMRVLASLGPRLDEQRLDQLARIANLAARRGWHGVALPDEEVCP